MRMTHQTAFDTNRRLYGGLLGEWKIDDCAVLDDEK